MATAALSAGAEWRRYFMLPIAAALGYATSVIHIYGLGSYIVPISEEFGWTRTQVTVGLTLSTLIQAILAIPLGLLIDRYGPRIFGVIGILMTTGAFALLSTATGDETQWYLLWLVLAAATLPVQATVWTSAVASRFEASRGMALAITLCGASLAATIFPPLAAWLIKNYGWQNALIYHGALWALIAFPINFIFLRGARDARRKAGDVADPQPVLGGVGLKEAFRSTVYLRLLLVSLLFTFTIIALNVHFVPILTGKGLTPLAAAGIASLIGLSSIAGRLVTGFLLDHLRPSLVGAGAFLLPAIGCLCLLVAGDEGWAQAGAAIMIGLTLGAEVDVLAFLTTRHFGLRSFGALYGGVLVGLSIGTSFGPLAASRIFDEFGHYAPFLWLTVAFMLISSLCLVSLPKADPVARGAAPA